MKKWIGIAAILICCGVYAMIKISISQYDDANPQEKQTPGIKRTGGRDGAALKEDSVSPDTAVQTDKAVPEEDSGNLTTAEQVEAVTKVFNEFVSALESKDYEQAWKLVSESLRSERSFEEFVEKMADVGPVLAKFTLRPESATKVGGRVRLVVTHPSFGDGNFYFVQEDGQWKIRDF